VVRTFATRVESLRDGYAVRGSIPEAFVSRSGPTARL